MLWPELVARPFALLCRRNGPHPLVGAFGGRGFGHEVGGDCFAAGAGAGAGCWIPARAFQAGPLIPVRECRRVKRRGGGGDGGGGGGRAHRALAVGYGDRDNAGRWIGNPDQDVESLRNVAGAEQGDRLGIRIGGGAGWWRDVLEQVGPSACRIDAWVITIAPVEEHVLARIDGNKPVEPIKTVTDHQRFVRVGLTMLG